jgi:hypothetical protein
MKKKNYEVITHEPVIGELRYGRELGRNTGQRFIFAACEGCGKTRWTEYRGGKAKDKKCPSCVKVGLVGVKLTHPDKSIIAEVGDIKTGEQLGLKYKEQRYIYEQCPNCHNQRWVQVQSAGKYPKCRKCINKGKVGENNGHWGGGRNKDAYGYILVKLQPSDPYYPMADKAGYVKEHRLVVAKKIGRCLEEWEVVHHIDSIRDHNNETNLKLIGTQFHNTHIEKVLKQREQENLKLKAENRLLKADMSEFI